MIVHRDNDDYEYLRVDRFDVVENYQGQEPRYEAVVSGYRFDISKRFSQLVPGAKGIALRFDECPGYFENNEDDPFLWVPVYYVKPDDESRKHFGIPLRR